MKKIKKIAAGLMAAAIAAAGMGSLTASAVSTSKAISLYDDSVRTYYTAYGNVNFIPTKQYTASTSSNVSAIYFKQVCATAGCNNFTLSSVTKFSYHNDTPFVTITRNSGDITWFHSSHIATARRRSGQDVTGGTAIYL